MEPYVPTYCIRCQQLQFHAVIGKPCQFCGHRAFAPVRPLPTFSQIDRRVLKALNIPPKDPKV